MSDDLIERLRVMHSDLLQGAYYEPHEDPDWDVTEQAADRITELEQALYVHHAGIIDEEPCPRCGWEATDG